MVADVRSAPYSRFNPHFNRKALDAALGERGIAYLFLGRALGGRPEDRACYEEGPRPLRPRGPDTPLPRGDRAGRRGNAKRARVALMCAEKEPLACHRTVLVGRHLAARGVAVAHILADG